MEADFKWSTPLLRWCKSGKGDCVRVLSERLKARGVPELYRCRRLAEGCGESHGGLQVIALSLSLLLVETTLCGSRWREWLWMLGCLGTRLEKPGYRHRFGRGGGSKVARERERGVNELGDKALVIRRGFCRRRVPTLTLSLLLPIDSHSLFSLNTFPSGNAIIFIH